MTSKPDTQKSTIADSSHRAACSINASGRTAIAAARGLKASEAPSQMWQAHVPLFIIGYRQSHARTGKPRITGQALPLIRRNMRQITMKAMHEIASPVNMAPGVVAPAGKALLEVLGLRASMSRSIQRLASMAAVRAATIARTTSVKSIQSREPATCLSGSIGQAAMNRPNRAKGRAKTLCASLMSRARTTAVLRIPVWAVVEVVVTRAS